MVGRVSTIDAPDNSYRWHLVKLRCSAVLASAFARESWWRKPWTREMWRKIMKANYQNLLFFFAEASDQGMNITSKDIWVNFTIESQETSSHESFSFTFPENLTIRDSRLETLVEAKPFCARTDLAQTTLKVHIGGSDGLAGGAQRVRKKFQEWLAESFQRQLEHVPCHEEIYPHSPDAFAISDDEKLHRLRVHLTEFLARFLDCFALRDNAPPRRPDPFTVFFIRPKDQPYVPSGMHGYKYFLDKGQKEWLVSGSGRHLFVGTDETIRAALLEGTEHVPSGKGLCYQVFLRAVPLDHWSTRYLVEDIHADSPNLYEAEKRLLQDCTLLEIPIYSQSISDLVTGPLLILCIRLPKKAAMIVDHLADENTPIPTSEPEWPKQLPPPEQSILRTGEAQIIFEVSQRLINDFISIGRSSHKIVGSCPEIETARRNLIKFSAAAVRTNPPTPIVLLGESGTGKTTFAEIAAVIARRPLSLKYDCGRLQGEPQAAELFGYIGQDEKGKRRGHPAAWTGADKKGSRGLFLENDGKAILLDNVQNISDTIKSQLLLFFDTNTVIPVGGIDGVPVNILFILTMVQPDHTKDDHFLNRFAKAFKIILPPLGARGDDIVEIAHHYLDVYAAEQAKGIMTFSKEAIDYLKNREWRDNIRGLDGLIKQAVVLTENSELTKDDFIIVDDMRKPF